MNSFSLNRFGKTLCWYVSINFRRLSMCTVSAFVGTFLVEMLYLLNYHAVDTSEIANISGFCAFAFAMVIVMGISGMMANLNKKSARSSFLMLPASNLEKYLSMLVYVTVILPVCVFVSIALGDTLRMAVRAWLYGDPWLSGVPRMLQTLGFEFSDPLWLPLLVLNILIIAWFLSLYVLGATFLRKFSFIVSSIVIILSFAAFWQFHKSLGLSMYYVKQIDGHIVSQSLGSRAYALFILLPLITAFNYWASYRIFKRFQLVTNKWTNYDVFKR